MKKNYLIFMISISLLTLSCKNKSHEVNDFIGSWSSEVSNQNENSSNTIKIKTIFYKNGSSEQISKGVFHINNETASFQIKLGMKWHLKDDNLIEELVSHSLLDLKGDEAATKIIKSNFDNMFQKKDSVGGLNNSKIKSISKNEIILVDKSDREIKLSRIK